MVESDVTFIAATISRSFALYDADGETIVAIDLDTGDVTLGKPVSEAAQTFWDAVKELVALER